MKPWQFVLAGCLAGASGCVDSKVTRAKIDPEPVKEAAVKTVGDISTIGNAAAIPVSGVGLVVGLDGTGGSAPPGMYRDILKDYLQKKGFENVRDILESPNHAMVMVTALIPPGARKGEMVDVQVTLPEGSKTRSLRGGHLEMVNLTTFDTQQNVRDYVAKNSDTKPTSKGNGLLIGNTLVVGEGPLAPPTADKMETGDDWKSAWVWGGGRCEIPNKFHVLLNPDQQRYAVAQTAANRINDIFHGLGEVRVADAKSKETIIITVPPLYKLNVPHFLRVMRNVPLDGPTADNARMRQWEEELKEPGTTVSAAVRLEAVGPDAKPYLKAALDSPYPLVRFAAAQSLCYLGESVVAEELGKLAEEHPALQAYCLTALASLNEAACYYKLQDLMGSAIPEVRYGAFRALREQDPNQDGVRGHKIAKSFYLHKVAPGSVPMRRTRKLRTSGTLQTSSSCVAASMPSGVTSAIGSSAYQSIRAALASMTPRRPRPSASAWRRVPIRPESSGCPGLPRSTVRLSVPGSMAGRTLTPERKISGSTHGALPPRAACRRRTELRRLALRFARISGLS